MLRRVSRRPGGQTIKKSKHPLTHLQLSHVVQVTYSLGIVFTQRISCPFLLSISLTASAEIFDLLNEMKAFSSFQPCNYCFLCTHMILIFLLEVVVNL
jgi:hypothetical protein